MSTQDKGLVCACACLLVCVCVLLFDYVCMCSRALLSACACVLSYACMCVRARASLHDNGEFSGLCMFAESPRETAADGVPIVLHLPASHTLLHLCCTSRPATRCCTYAAPPG